MVSSTINFAAYEALGELFVKYRGLGFKRSSQKDIVYKAASPELALGVAKQILDDYVEIIKEIDNVN